MTTKNDKPNYAAYWAAALARHRERIAAGCISAVGVKRVSAGKKEAEPKEQDNDD